jgi:hypothetical protein
MLKEERIRTLVRKLFQEFNLTPSQKTWFGKSDLFSGSTQFIDITDDINGKEEKVGEVELGKIDSHSVEIVSIYMIKLAKGKGYGRKAIQAIFSMPGINRIYMVAAKTSLKFWKKMGAVPAKIPGKGREFYVINKASAN